MIVAGSVRTRAWTDADGAEHTRLEVPTDHLTHRGCGPVDGAVSQVCPSSCRFGRAVIIKVWRVGSVTGNLTRTPQLSRRTQPMALPK